MWRCQALGEGRCRILYLLEGSLLRLCQDIVPVEIDLVIAKLEELLLGSEQGEYTTETAMLSDSAPVIHWSGSLHDCRGSCENSSGSCPV